MAKRILVPLDETVRLLHVAPTPEHVMSEGPVVAYADQAAAQLEERAA